MGDLTFAQMRTLVKRTVNNRDDLDTEVDQAINQAYLETAMIRGLRFKELDAGPHTFSTVDGTRTYSFDTILGVGSGRNIAAVYGVYDVTNKRPIKPHSIAYFDTLDQTIEGYPMWYAHVGTGIELHKTPDAVYSIRLRSRKRPAKLSSASDKMVLPEEFDFVVAWNAASTLNAIIGQLDKSSFYSSKKNESLSAIRTTLEIEDEYEDFALAPDLS